MERYAKGIYIPIEIWEMKDKTVVAGTVRDSEGNETVIYKPTCTDKFIFAEIDSLDAGGGTKVTDEKLADIAGCSKATVAKSIDYWIEKGFLTQSISSNGTRTIKSAINKYSHRTIKDMCSGKITKESANDSLGKSYSDIVADLPYGNELKDALMKFITNNRCKFSTRQLEDKIKDLETKCGKDEKWMTETVNQSYLNSWMGFFPNKIVRKVEEEKKPDRGHIKVTNHHTVKVTELVQLSRDELDELIRNPRCTPRNGKWAKRSYDPNKEEDYKIIEKAVRLTCGEVECYLKELINSGYHPKCEGTAPILKWLDSHQDWPKYFERDDFCWWMKD